MEMKNATELGTRIRTIRKREELTQEKFAKKLGVSKETVGNIERGDNEPSLYIIKKICKEFNYSADFVMGVEAPTSAIIKDIHIPIKDLFIIRERKHFHFKNTKQKITVEVYLRLTKENLLKIFDDYFQEVMHYLGYISDEQWENLITAGIFRYPENRTKEVLIHTFTYEI